jgi:hypothetical protein
METTYTSQLDEDRTVEAEGSASEEMTGIVAELGSLGPGAVLTEEGLARLFSRHRASVKRAVGRGELPPPCRLFGGNVWTAGALVSHFERRQEDAARESAELSRKVHHLKP